MTGANQAGHPASSTHTALNRTISDRADYHVNDKLRTKYIFGYSAFFYDRTTDTDLTDSQVFDRQFYVTQEAEYASNEFQVFWKISLGSHAMTLRRHGCQRQNVPSLPGWGGTSADSSGRCAF